jgi:hypothetical protein
LEELFNPQRKQDPVQPKRPRDLRERLKDIRKKIKEGKVKPIPMPKVKEMTPLGKMKKPRPGTYDYQLLQTQKPGYRVAPMEKNKNKPQKKMGGGMMQRPMMAMGGGMMPGYKKGKSVMAKGCKLGRKKPTKMYT